MHSSFTAWGPLGWFSDGGLRQVAKKRIIEYGLFLVSIDMQITQGQVQLKRRGRHGG